MLTVTENGVNNRTRSISHVGEDDPKGETVKQVNKEAMTLSGRLHKQTKMKARKCLDGVRSKC